MTDQYSRFEALARCEVDGRDFRVRSCQRDGATIVVAPHGGRIEPGTSEIAEAIAGADLSFYAFEGTRSRDNGWLHITSTRFDEPQCLKLIASVERVVTVHGETASTRSSFLEVAMKRASLTSAQLSNVEDSAYENTGAAPCRASLPRTFAIEVRGEQAFNLN